ncbi:MAG: ABC transporter ATP-binding protein, partial [Chloroflexi bacterium CFX6]|nr:ABC transporter ATP-binding protein [Chloroflexi bacterium CFX6]
MSTDAWLEDDRPEGAYDRVLIRWMLAYARPQARALAGCVALLLVLAGLQLAQPWVIKQAIDAVIRPAEGTAMAAGASRIAAPLWPYVAAYAGLATAAAGVMYLQTYWLRMTGQRIIMRVREDVFAHLQTLSLSFFDRNPTGRTVTRVTNDVEALNEMYTSVLVNLFRDVFFMTGAVLVLLRLDWRLATLSFAILPVVVVMAIVFRTRSRAAWRSMRVLLARINAKLAEQFGGMRVVQLYGRQAADAAAFAAINDGFYAAARHLIRVFAVFSPVLDLLTTVALAAVVWYGGGQALAGAITVGTLYAFTAYVRRLYEPVSALAEKYNIMQSALASAERISRLMATEPEVRDPVDPVAPPPRVAVAVDGGPRPAPVRDIAPAVAFDDVWFAYTPGEWVLRGVSFAVHPGETVAFVGHTGAGKSTIMSLLPRFYDVQRGAVRVHGVDVRRWRQRDLRRCVGVVLQDVFLFAGDVASNIGLWEPALSRRQIERAAGIVGADQFVKRLPGGYDEPVVERGLSLSAGQRQLISFARALAYDPEI